jgi:hypothetical protein
MGKGRTAIVLERAEHGIGVDLVATAVEKTSTIIAAEIVAVRDDSPGIVKVRIRRTGVYDSICDLQCSASDVEDTALFQVYGLVREIVGQSAVGDRQCAAVTDTAAIAVRMIPAKGAIGDCQRAAVINTPSSGKLFIAGRVAADSAVGDRHYPTVTDTAGASVRPVLSNSAIGNRHRPAVGDTASSATGKITADRAVGDFCHALIENTPRTSAKWVVLGLIATDRAVANGQCAIDVVINADARAAALNVRRRLEGEDSVAID